MLSIIIPAHNEEAWIGGCLRALTDQSSEAPDWVEIVIAANACSDATIDVIEGHRGDIQRRGWTLHVLSITKPGKPNALNAADAVASGKMRLYLDADVVCEADMLEKLHAALDRPDPAYAGGHLVVAPTRNWVTHYYGRLWSRLPFASASGTTGAGLFAVNASGRARWGMFPEIISDDTFVRLQFHPTERIAVSSSYYWPMVEGISALVRVRRRQNAGIAELQALHPRLFKNEGKPRVTWSDHVRLCLEMPFSYIVYVAISTIVRATRANGGETWARGR